MADLPNTGAAPGPSAESSLNDSGLAEMFSPSPTSDPAPAAEGAQAQPAPASGQPGQVPAPAATPPVTASAPDANSQASELATLRAQIAELQSRQVPAQPGPQGQAQPPADPWEQTPNYNFQMPPQIVDALSNPDPAVRAQALTAVTSAIAQVTHRQVLGQMKGLMEQMRNELRQVAQTDVSDREMQRTVNQDFYGKYPQYNTPMLRPLVQMAIMEVAKANPAFQTGQWTPELRDAVGTYLQKNIPLMQAQQAAAPPAPKGPPQMMGSGARPGTGEVLTGQDKALAEMFG